MSKVLVDRELLERMIQLDSLGLCAQQEYAALRTILAQPAEAEGAVEMGSDAWMALHLLDRLDVSADEEPRVQQVEEIVRRMGAALSAVTAERDRLREDRDSQQRVCIAEMEKVSQLRAEVEGMRALLSKSLPVVEAHAGASHMLEGFRPIRNKWDELVDGIRAAMAAKEA